jgi:hypothetical protein
VLAETASPLKHTWSEVVANDDTPHPSPALYGKLWIAPTQGCSPQGQGWVCTLETQNLNPIPSSGVPTSGDHHLIFFSIQSHSFSEITILSRFHEGLNLENHTRPGHFAWWERGQMLP